MKRPLLITSVAALAAGACVERIADDGTVATQQAALSATTGDLSVTLLWNGSVVDGRDRDLFFVDVTGPSGRVRAAARRGVALVPRPGPRAGRLRRRR